jgi:type VI secretion system protein ImpL
MLPLLFDKREGLIVKFLQGPAAPFVSRNRHGFLASKALGHRIDFSQEFLDFVNRGMEGFVVAKPEYEVTLETLPIGANEGARVKPQGNVLELDCAQNRVVLTNLNYPESQTFQWNPQTCGPVTLKILFPHLTLTKRYDGPYGFVEFLAEFRTGSRTFSSGDFPSWQKALQEMGISWVRLRYEVQGAEPILQLLKKAPTEVPQHIVAERLLKPY